MDKSIAAVSVILRTGLVRDDRFSRTAEAIIFTSDVRVRTEPPCGDDGIGV